MQALQGGVDREFQETAALEKCRGSHCRHGGGVRLVLSAPELLGGGQMRVQWSGEPYDERKGVNDTGGNHCV